MPRSEKIYSRATRLLADKTEAYDYALYDTGIVNRDVYNNCRGWNSERFSQIAKEHVLEVKRSRFRPIVKDGNYTCKLCGSKKTYIISIVTRSLDEPMTTFAVCSMPACKGARYKI